jgi:ABC-type ATPase with predicted acetyltransferase domain
MKKEWECWDCGFIFEKDDKPEICPKCQIINKMKTETYFIELPRSRKPLMDEELLQIISDKNVNISKAGNQL